LKKKKRVFLTGVKCNHHPVCCKEGLNSLSLSSPEDLGAVPFFSFIWNSSFPVLLNMLFYSVLMEDEPNNETNKQKTKSITLARERTTPTERPTLVGEVKANVCG
jgi:hypothetical protein